MIFRRHRLHIAFILCILIFSASVATAQVVTKELTKGVTLKQNIGGSQIINVLTVDPKAPGVRIQAILAQDKIFATDSTKGREIVSSIAKRLNAVAVINADFFPMQSNCPGDVLNLHISGGELMSEPMPNRVVFGITSDKQILFDRLELDARITLPDGKWFPIRGINRPRSGHELVAYTSGFASSTCTTSAGSEAIITTQDLPVKVGVPIKGTVSEAKSSCGNTAIPERAIVLSGVGTGSKFVDDNLKPGTTVTIEFKLKPTKTTGWEKVTEAVGGGPWLVKDGKVNVDAKEQGFQTGFYAGTHPRTAIGATADGKLVLATVDGRQKMSVGMSLVQLAKEMLAQKCVEAINLDGGGSTTMATSLGLLNSPSEGTERLVANALAVFADVASEPEVDFTIVSTEPVLSGTTVQMTLADKDGKPLSADIAKRAIWSGTGGAGFLDQSGVFRGIKARKGTISAQIGARTASIPIETVPGPIVKLSLQLAPDYTDAPNRNTLVVIATDANGNAIRDGQVSVKVEGGIPDQANLTISEGKATTGITWDAAPGDKAQVEIICGHIKSVINDSSKD